MELCYYPKCAKRNRGVTSHPRVSAPAVDFTSRCLSYLFWGCTEGHCVPYEVLGAQGHRVLAKRGGWR